MAGRQDNRLSDWSVILERISAELMRLGEDDRQWLRQRLDAIERFQVSLNKLFCKSGGTTACADCDGACCGCGRHHITLTNLLAYLDKGETPPEPDFNHTCPFLGATGCQMSVARRPYNCITFFCEQLEGSLDNEDRKALRELDQLLRREYQSVAERYPAASLRGLWIAMERIGPGQIILSTK